MPLAAGTRLGPYEIAEPIGSGGMGEVYRARDTALERDVAIKVLPESFASDAAWVARFEREAKTLAALNHPNIAHIYGLERSNGATALVMELVDGPTLADRIAEGPLPANEALGIAMQVAAALEAAHGQGIVHRDLKPANIKLKPDGTIKVLDFGIAKTLDIHAPSGAPAAAMTTPNMTQTGIILGTAAYMSPEQARGRPIDDRTDIWAFGCLLYEMLTGQPAFAGEDIAITLARILANDTDMKSLPAVISPAVRQTIELCLRKDLKKRIADIRDVRLALAGAFDTVSPQVAGAAAVARPLWRRILPIAAAMLATGAIVGFTTWRGMQPAPLAVTRFDYDLPRGQRLRQTERPAVAISPDGRAFVYNTENGLYVRSMGELDARLIPGTEANLSSVTFSPDSRSIAYSSAAGDLRRISISGGAPVVIAGVDTNPYGMSWGSDDMILFVVPAGVMRVSANGGTPELVIPAPAEQNQAFWGPRLLPDGDSVLFTTWQGGGALTAQVVVQSLSTGERTVLVKGGGDARYVPTGHLVYALGDGLFAVAFDLDSRTVSGGAVPVVQGVMRGGGANVTTPVGTPQAQYDVSANGSLVYLTGTGYANQSTLVWVDRDGNEEPTGADPRSYAYPRISPDGTKVALDVRDQENDIWIWDLDRETLTRLTFDPGLDRFPAWSPDGRMVAFSSQQGAGGGPDATSLFWKAADGAGSAQKIVGSGGQIFPNSFTHDATAILVSGALKGGSDDDDIAIVRLEGEDHTIEPIMQTTFQERNSEVSPDGHWLAYSSNESGRDEIYVRPFPDTDARRWQVSTGGGVQPLWARSGQELFYRSGDAVLSVPVDTEPSFSAGNPQVLFEGRYSMGPGGRAYDVSPDGKRFLMIKGVEDTSAASQVIVVENWFTELERLARTD